MFTNRKIQILALIAFTFVLTLVVFDLPRTSAKTFSASQPGQELSHPQTSSFSEDFGYRSLLTYQEDIFDNGYENHIDDNPPVTGNLTTEIAKIFTTDSAAGFGKFGNSVAISGNTAVIAVPNEIVGAHEDQGAAYIFVRSGNSWSFQQRLIDVDGITNTRFGNSVAIDGDTVVVGSNFSHIGSNLAQGAAFVFVRNGTTWSLQQKLLASDGANNDLFGFSVAISNDTIAVTATEDDIGANLNQGSAYIFVRNGTNWTEQQKLTAPDGVQNETFGWSVAAQADSVIVGSQLSRIGVNNSQGAAYVFTRSGAVWTQEAKLVSTDGSFDDHFGVSVALDDNTAVVGSYGSDFGSNINQGAAYVFSRNGTIWNQQAKLFAPDGSGADQFGISVALDGETVVAGANRNNPGGQVRVGAAYLYTRNGVNWSQRAKLIESDFMSHIVTDQFGFSVAVQGNQILVGAPLDDFGVMFRRGSVYFFLTPTVAPDLQPASDSGVSSTDNITRNRQLAFNISGVTSGAVVNLLRDNVVVASAAASGTDVTLTDPLTPENGTFNYTAQQVTGGETSSLSDSTLVTIDNNSPNLMINQASAQPDPTRIQPLNFTATANEPVTGFEASDISLNGSTAGVSNANISVSGSGSVYNVAVDNITADGTVIASVPVNAVQDLAGNLSAASTSTDNTITLDTIAPTVTINQSATQADPTRNLPVNFTVVFNEAVTDFNNADVLLTGSTANVGSAIITVTGSGTNYNVAVSGISSNGGFVQTSIRPQAAADAAGNLSLASTSIDNTVMVDNTQPSVTINQSAGQPDPTAIIPLNFTVVFNEPVTGFEASDISFTGSTVGTAQAIVDITGSGTTYNVSVGGNIISNGGFLQVRVLSGAAQDALGNSSLPSTSTDNRITIDNVAPTVTLNQAVGQADPASTQPVNFTVLFSEPVTGFNAADVSLAGSTANVSFANISVTGSGSAYTVSIRNITSNGELRASIPGGAAVDSVGNLSSASTSVDNIVSINLKDAIIDFDGDGKTDISIFRPSDGSWWYSRSSDSQFRVYNFGISTDKLVPSDFTGDGKTDIAVFRPSTGEWFIQRSEDGSFYSVPFGASGDLPVVGDFDADAKTDIGVFRPSASTWFINKSSGGTLITTFGTTGDQPVAADYDGDGRTDIAIFRPSDGSWWYVRSSDNQFRVFSFGVSTDKPVPGDYTGDGRSDIAVFRPSTGEWFIQRSEDNSYFSFPFGASGDLPVPGDYDGDGKTDAGVFRPTSSTWFINRTTAGVLITNFGTSGDQPVPNAFVP